MKLNGRPGTFSSKKSSDRNVQLTLFCEAFSLACCKATSETSTPVTKKPCCASQIELWPEPHPTSSALLFSIRCLFTISIRLKSTLPTSQGVVFALYCSLYCFCFEAPITLLLINRNYVTFLPFRASWCQ